jgi:hypothetical protein
MLMTLANLPVAIYNHWSTLRGRHTGEESPSRFFRSAANLGGRGNQRNQTRSGTMSEEARFEMPKEMRNMAEASVQQARKTFEKLLTGAEVAADTME